MAAAVVAQQQQEEEEQKRAQQQNQLQLDVVNSLQSMNNNSVIEEGDDKGELTCYEDTSEMTQDENMMTQAETSGVSRGGFCMPLSLDCGTIIVMCVFISVLRGRVGTL